MSTRANIAIILKEEDLNVTLVSPVNENNTLTPEKRVLRIYVHNDGYVHGGLGEFLYREFPEKEKETYDNLLGYLMEGDRSTTELAYNSWRGEEEEPWETVKPEELDLPENLEDITLEEYLYLYDPEKLEWTVVDYYGKTISPLGEELDNPDPYSEN